MVSIVAASTPVDIAAVRELFLEYAASLEIDLGFQGFEAELERLPGEYTAPHGILLLARDHTLRVLGCVGVRPIEWPDSAELKRLYVRPSARGLGVGRTLALASVEAARAMGYLAIRLDTLPTMAAAVGVYEGLGFREIEAYRHNPVEGARYLELRLA